MRTVWINGWATTKEETLSTLRKWRSGWEHHVVQPSPEWREEALALLDRHTWLCGYSLGAFLLLRESGLNRKAFGGLLVAPFVDLRLESERGGRVRRAALLKTLRWLRRDPVSAVADFRARAGLVTNHDAERLPPEQLSWGLRKLVEDPEQPNDAADFRCLVGQRDPLLDARWLELHLPRVRSVRQATHALDSVLRLSDALR